MFVLIFWLVSCRPTTKDYSIAGTYQLIDWKIIQRDSQYYPYGQEAGGQIQYSKDGYMSLQLSKGNRAKFGTLDRSDLDSGASAQAYTSYFAYWGSYEIKKDSGMVVHYVDECLHPDWNQTTQIRNYRLSNDTLFLSTEKGDLLRFRKCAKATF